MHELAIARNLIEIVEEEACRHGLVKVVVIRLQIGVLAGVRPGIPDVLFRTGKPGYDRRRGRP